MHFNGCILEESVGGAAPFAANQPRVEIDVCAYNAGKQPAYVDVPSGVRNWKDARLFSL